MEYEANNGSYPVWAWEGVFEEDQNRKMQPRQIARIGEVSLKIPQKTITHFTDDHGYRLIDEVANHVLLPIRTLATFELQLYRRKTRYQLMRADIQLSLLTYFFCLQADQRLS